MNAVPEQVWTFVKTSEYTKILEKDGFLCLHLLPLLDRNEFALVLNPKTWKVYRQEKLQGIWQTTSELKETELFKNRLF